MGQSKRSGGSQPQDGLNPYAMKDVWDGALSTVHALFERSSVEEHNDLPEFRVLGPEFTLTPGARSFSSIAESLQKLRTSFTPTQPKLTAQLFSGRRQEVKRIVTAIEEWRAHIVIFGERGYGKSSLANIVSEIARQGGVSVLSCSCSAEIKFEDMFRGFLRDIPLPQRDLPNWAKDNPKDGASLSPPLSSLLPTAAFGASELAEVLRLVKDRHVIFRIDEFDRARDPDLRIQLAEAIKSLSDVGARITLMIVGVADDLDELLGRHPSIQRNVVGIRLGLMSNAELLSLIRAGEKNAGINFSADARARIVSLAQGLPYQVQMLCQQAGQVAIEDGSSLVTMVHLRTAISEVLERTPPLLQRAYAQAFLGADRDVLEAVAIAAARCVRDEQGFFTARQVCDELKKRKAGLMAREDKIQSLLEGLARNGPKEILKLRRNRQSKEFAFADDQLKSYLSFKDFMKSSKQS